MSSLQVCRFSVFDFKVEYAYRPNDDIYQELLPKEIELALTVPGTFKRLTYDEQKAILKDPVMAALGEQVMFDTPDAPDFEISDIDFCFEAVD